MTVKAEKPKIILASGSPRRKEILEKMGLEFTVVPSVYEEDMTLPLPPRELAMHLAMGKAREVVARFPRDIIVAADTIVVLDNEVLGKPHTGIMAEKMLRKLSGKKHKVFTGLVVLYKPKDIVTREAVETGVFFKVLNNEQIRNYIDTGEPLDKAGAYAVQGLGGELVEKIEGDYWSVVGLPAKVLAKHLRTFGIHAKSL